MEKNSEFALYMGSGQLHFLWLHFFPLFVQKSFDHLTHLDLFNNEICNMEDYRSKVFKLLPNLKYLDDADADENEEEGDEESDDGEVAGANGAVGDDDDEDDDDGTSL